MLTYNLDIEDNSRWLRTTPADLALKQPFYCTEAGLFYARESFNTVRDYKDSWLLFYTTEGCGIISQNHATVHLEPGHALLLNCRSPQEYYTDPRSGKWTHYWIHFNGEGVLGLEELLIPDQKISPVVYHPGSANPFEKILGNLENTSSESILSDSLLIHEILTQMAVRPEGVVSAHQKAIMKSAAYLQQHFAEPVDLSVLFDLTGMSRAYFMRQFRKYIGTTPYNYILSLRITQAKEYLEVTDITVSEIALRTGFSDVSSFSTRFSAMTGMSPLKYRKEAITRRQRSV